MSVTSLGLLVYTVTVLQNYTIQALDEGPH